MRKHAVHPLAVAAVTALTAGALAAGAAPAAAGGDHGEHGDHDGYDVTIPLTEPVSDQLLDGANDVDDLGRADVWTDDERVVLSFPVQGADDERHRRSGGDHGDETWALSGGIAFTGAGPEVRWTDLRVDREHGVITAVLSGGPRAAILSFDSDHDSDHDSDRDHRSRTGDHGSWLELTAAGATSLNNAADGSPFEAGDTFAGGEDCDR